MTGDTAAWDPCILHGLDLIDAAVDGNDELAVGLGRMPIVEAHPDGMVWALATLGMALADRVARLSGTDAAVVMADLRSQWGDG